MDKNNLENDSFEGLLKRTQAFDKFRSCFESMERDRNFILKIRGLRHRLNLPKDGLPFPKDKKEVLENHSKIFSKLDEEDKVYYWRATDDISNNYHVHIYGDALEFYIFYGSIDPFVKFGSIKFAQVLDLQEIFSEEHSGKIDPFSIATCELEKMYDKFPIAILINPYMSERDIIDFVRKTYKKWILPIQEDYKSKITPLGKARKKSSLVRERNEFIFANKDKQVKDIVHLVSEKFGKSLDYTQVHKIIREEISKRN